MKLPLEIQWWLNSSMEDYYHIEQTKDSQKHNQPASCKNPEPIKEVIIIHLLVTISETTKFLLPSCIPAVEANLSTVCKEIQWMNLHTNSCYILQENMKKLAPRKAKWLNKIHPA